MFGTYGGIYELSSLPAAPSYFAWRKNWQVHRDGCATPSDAYAAKLAGWTLDIDTITELRIAGVKYVGVIVSDTGYRYLTDLDAFLTPGRFYVNKDNPNQRGVRCHEFPIIFQPKTKIR